MPRLSRAEAEDILYSEARLLDERRYHEWLNTLTADAIYWMPANGHGVDPNREIALVYDNSLKLRDRIDRLASGVAHAQSPPSRTKRLVSNVQVEASEENAAKILSALLLYELRRGKERIFAGRCEYQMRFDDSRWKIAAKKVILVNNDEVIDNLTFIV
jgi:3-phenylpropionate/cinnamic acid dioxygenase small subunit